MIEDGWSQAPHLRHGEIKAQTTQAKHTSVMQKTKTKNKEDTKPVVEAAQEARSLVPTGPQNDRAVQLRPARGLLPQH